MDTKVVAFLPVRGGSKGIPKKNIKDLAGKPLLHWMAQACIDADKVDELVVATDSEEIASVARQLGSKKFTIFYRNPDNCTDSASTESAMIEFAEAKNDFSHIMLVQATSPLIQSHQLDEAIEKFFKSDADSLIALVRQLKFIWDEQHDGSVIPLNYQPQSRPRRQEFTGILTEPGAFYLTRRQDLLRTRCRISGKVLGYELPEDCYWDLDTMAEWRIVEEILKYRTKYLK